jgi:hypothetical protein
MTVIKNLGRHIKADQLNPYYYYLNQFFRATIDPKIGDVTALR